LRKTTRDVHIVKTTIGRGRRDKYRQKVKTKHSQIIFGSRILRQQIEDEGTALLIFWHVAPCSPLKMTDVSEMLAVSIIKAIDGQYRPDYTAQNPRRQPSSHRNPCFLSACL
jgi:hypothetical protein